MGRWLQVPISPVSKVFEQISSEEDEAGASLLRSLSKWAPPNRGATSGHPRSSGPGGPSAKLSGELKELEGCS